MNNVVKSIEQGSPASNSVIAQGDVLLKVNGDAIRDVLDYQFLTYDSSVQLRLLSANGKLKLVTVNKPEGVDLGIEFGSYLMDNERVCENRCIFCFMSQLPAGMRRSLYCRDDDVRLSFLHGNYVTLTNLTKDDIDRIIEYRISPINISVHTLDPKLRSFMMGTSKGGKSLSTLRRLASNGITLNCQIVCCPGVNSGKKLRATLEGLRALGSAINSVSVVPVGLTKHRDGQYPLKPFDKRIAINTLNLVRYFARSCLRERGSRVFYCADEIYLLAGVELPNESYYEDYPQLENGVGMLRLFIAEFENAIDNCKSTKKNHKHISVATGKLAYPYIKNIVDILLMKCDTITCDVYAITNDFFGHGITVSGLITGSDILNQLSGKNLGSKLLIPQNMLKFGEDVFLDDVTVSEISEKLGVEVMVVEQNGREFFNALSESIDHIMEDENG
ncbi:MAG: DUF512 domain-containing protein [Oscillospiraceae bacterium]|nr:DUF512 domain-containing protein [Oscillospiraceae bacterium]